MDGTDQPQGRGRLKRLGRVIFGADKEVSAWVATKIDGFTVSEDARALGVISGDRLVAGVVFERWNGVHVEASIAATPGARWADRSTLFSLFWYPFGTLDCRAITVTVPMSNLPSLNLATKLGFKPQAIVPFAARDGGALLVLQEYRDTCRWIGHHGQEQQGAGGA